MDVQMFYFLSLLASTLVSISGLASNILILHPIYSGSHEHVLRSVAEHLIKNRGHNVTQVKRHLQCCVFRCDYSSQISGNLINILRL